MKLKNIKIFVNNHYQNIGTFVAIFVFIFLGLSYTQFHGASAFFYPAAGLYTAFYFIYRKQLLPGIISSILIANFVFRLIYIDEAFYITFMLSILFTIANGVEIYLFSFLMDKSKLKLNKELDFNELGKYFGIIILTALSGAIIGVVSIDLFYRFTYFWNELFYWFIGSLSGILIFGSLVLNSHFHDHPFKEGLSRYKSSIVYLVAFISIVLFVFIERDNNYITFTNFQIFIVLMYIIAAFKFSFRMIAISNLIIMIGLNSIYLRFIEDSDYLIEAIQINLFILILSSIASIVRIVLLQRKQNYENMKRANDNLERMIISTNQLFQIDNKMPDEANEFSRNYLKNMFEIACDIYPRFDRASCHIQKGKYVEFVAVKGYDIDHLNNLQFLSKEFEWSLRTPKIIKNTNYQDVFEQDEKTQDFFDHYGRLRESIRFTVIISENEYAGMSFDYFNHSDHHYTAQDIANFESFQSLMNSYYKIGVLSSEKEQLKDDIVLSLVRTLELYDHYTGGHSEQVAKLSAIIARRLHLPKNEVRDIYWAGIVHDIGKIGLPEHILNKEGRLTDDEYDLVKNHSIYGYNILSQSEGLMNISETVKHHHEWWNGKGYPDGLKGEEIPFHSQILHVCDAVDAMSHNRVYHKKLTPEEVIEELTKGIGEQFSPKVTKVMIQFIQEGHLFPFIQ